MTNQSLSQVKSKSAAKSAAKNSLTLENRRQAGKKRRFPVESHIGGFLVYFLDEHVVLKSVSGEPFVLRVGDELVELGLPAHKRVYVGPMGPYGENVVDPAKAQAARLVHLNSIPNWQQLLVVSFGLAGARLGTQAERRFGRSGREEND